MNFARLRLAARTADDVEGGGRMRFLAAIHPPEAREAILGSLGLPVRAPPTLPARPDDDLEATTEAWGYEPGPDA